jgi:hypothetical protein
MINSPRNRKNTPGRDPRRLIHRVLQKGNYKCICALPKKSQGQFLNSFPLRKHYCHLLSILILAFVLPQTFKIRFNRVSVSGKLIVSWRILVASCIHFSSGLAKYYLLLFQDYRLLSPHYCPTSSLILCHVSYSFTIKMEAADSSKHWYTLFNKNQAA